MGSESQFNWPTGHGAWFYSEMAEFEAGAGRYLAEGVRAHERVLFAAGDPGLRRWPEDLVGDGVLVPRSLGELFGPLQGGDLAGQRELFASVVTEALRDGFSGVRLVADNTAMMANDVERWAEWESVADSLMASNPLAVLCGFDRSRLSLDQVHSMMLLHPRVVGEA